MSGIVADYSPNLRRL